MASTVNLDALVRREDFQVVNDGVIAQPGQTIQIRDLEPGAFFYPVLRKPDFQRETSDWTHKKVCDFVESYLNGDLIPAIILWQSGTYIFVIDGAHRLSALIAWVHDDYGDGELSRAFFEQRIPEEQIKVAEKTRRLIKQKIGSYTDHKFAIQYPERSTPEVVGRAQRLAALALHLQWVKGDASKAEASFFRINQQATPINKTELKLLESRKKPNALAARAIIRSGTGHKYWSEFSSEIQQSIQQIAQEINTILFVPSLQTPIKTLDLPVAGQVYSGKALPLVFDFINAANDERMKEEPPDDVDGGETIKYLKQTRKIVYRISGTHPSSLGLHPVVYFYSITGRYQPTSFLAIVALIQELENNNLYRSFTNVREKLEKFLLRHKDIQNQVAVKYGVGIKGGKYLADLYLLIVKWLNGKKTEKEILENLQADENFSFLKLLDDSESVTYKKDFSSETKTTVFLREALKEPLRCQICKGLIHLNSISFDHIIRKQDGGLGAADNAQLTHMYCNTTYKN